MDNKCSVPGCLVAHDINVIDEHNIWDVYESFDKEGKVRALNRWQHIYKDVDSDFARKVVKKCKELLKHWDDFEKKLTLARRLIGDDVQVYGNGRLWYVKVPETDGSFSHYKFPEWNGWRWVIPNSLKRPGNLGKESFGKIEEDQCQ